jgi:hypothetical protein
MRLDDVGGEEDDEVSVGAGSGDGGGGGGADEAVANEAVDVAVAAVVDDEAVGPPLLLGELIDATIDFLLMMMPMLTMTFLLHCQFLMACCRVQI